MFPVSCVYFSARDASEHAADQADVFKFSTASSTHAIPRCTGRSSDRLRSKTLPFASLLLRTSGRSRAGAAGARARYVLVKYLARSTCMGRISGSARRRPLVLTKQWVWQASSSAKAVCEALAGQFPKKAASIRSTFQAAFAALAKRRGEGADTA